MWTNRWRWLALCSAAAMIGCTARPSVDVMDIRVVDQTEQGGRVLLYLDVVNPNDFPMPTPTANYEIRVDGAGVFAFNGVVPLAAMPAQGSQTYVFPAAFDTTSPLSGRRYATSGSLKYEPPGEWQAFLTESGFPLPDVDFSASGTIE